MTFAALPSTTITPKVQMYLPSPEVLAGVTAWYRAWDLAASLVDGDPVTSWPDGSGHGRTLVSSGTPPTFRRSVFNGRPAVQFVGTGHLTEGAAFTFGDLVGALGVGTVIVVGRFATGGGIFSQASPGESGLLLSSGTPGATGIKATANDGISESTVRTGAFDYVTGVFMWRYTGANLNAGAIASGHNLDDADLSATGCGTITSLGSGVRVGVGIDAAELVGHITDVVFLNRSLTEAERGQLGALLCARYALSYVGTPSATLSSSLWVDVPDVVSGVKASWGIHGHAPKDRTAEPGHMGFDLDDSAQNAGALRGFYSPENPGSRYGFVIGAPVRLVLTNDLLGSKVKWQGTVEGIHPVPGVRDPRTSVSCVDWMDEAQRAKLSGIPVQTNIQSDVLFRVLAAAVSKQPPNGIVAGTGSDIYPYALDNAQDETSKVLGEIQNLVLSEFGMAYVDAGVLVFEGRKLRGGPGSVRFALDDSDNIVEMSAAHDRNDVLNRIKVYVHPRRVDAAATTVLFTLGSAATISRNTSATLSCQYRDPAQISQRVGGKDMVAPVITTDYLFNTLADGTGADISTQLSVVAAFGGNTASVVITNNGPLDGFLTMLQLRGRGLYDFEPVVSDQANKGSVTAYGEDPFEFDMPHQASVANGFDVALFILGLNQDPATRVTSVSFLANWSDVEAERAFNLRISDRVSVTSASLGLSARQFFVNGISLDVEHSGTVKVTLDLAPADETQFWVLDIPGRTELDLTTVLGFGLFTPGWILDSSALGSDTFLN